MVTQTVLRKSPAILFLGRFVAWKAWEEAGSQCGCRGDGRRRKELEQTEGEMGVVGFASH